MFDLDEVGKVALTRAVVKTTAMLGGTIGAIFAASYVVNTFDVETLIPIAGIIAFLGLIVYLIKWRYEMERWDIESKNRELMRELQKKERDRVYFGNSSSF
jgi:hypothetical protein